ncbi:MAG: hypothetical protein WDN03_16135 [Rhizomicrobium sp.]
MTTMDPAMLGLANRIAGFIRSGDDRELDSVFAREVTIIENFAPAHLPRRRHLARGDARASALLERHAVCPWPAHGLQRDRRARVLLRAGHLDRQVARQAFRELGGKSLVLQKEDGAWRVAAYAWAVIEMRFL